MPPPRAAVCIVYLVNDFSRNFPFSDNITGRSQKNCQYFTGRVSSHIQF